MKRKDLLGIKDLSKEEILEVLDTAKEMKKILNGEKYSQILKGKTVVTIFSNLARGQDYLLRWQQSI